MRIPSFVIRNQRSIHLATCDDVPRIMVLTGPNGSGKSTLLDGIRRVGGGVGPILYVGPNRSSRRQKVMSRHLFQNRIDMRKLLSEDKLPGYEGIDIPGTSRRRTAWDSDEASSFLKHGLCQIELDRRNAVTKRYDSSGEIQKGTLPDVWMPLKEMTENLLPHLRFSEIDMENRDQVQCLWHVHTKDIVIDIDDLSSGEKAVIQLFFPLVENRIQSLISQTKGEDSKAETEDVCVLMDEPELHLHPVLQDKILDYIRTISIKENVQFILATHSPTLVEGANSEELFLLRPAELVSGDENQLLKIASDDEKLELIRDVFGSTSNITAMRPLLVVEGRKENKDSTRPADSRIYSFLDEKFNRITIVPGGGKSECKKLALSLTEILKEFSPSIKAYALLDRDLEKEDDEDPLLYFLPVSMIENLLVDPEIIWKAIVTVRHKTEFDSQDDLKEALDSILDSLEQEEKSRRVKESIGTQIFRVQDPIEEIDMQLSTFMEKLKEIAAPNELEKLNEMASEEIAIIKENYKRREYFHGKKILSNFYKSFLHSTGMSKEIFVYECAREASKRSSVINFVTELFEKIIEPTKV